MAFAFNAALIKTEEDNINEKPKVNKDNLINLFKVIKRYINIFKL